MRVLVLHDELVADARTDELDTLEQAAAVAAALRAQGHAVTLRPCGLDLPGLLADAAAQRPAVCFNLVESVARSGRLAHLPAQVLEHSGVPCTGSSAAALWLSGDKLLAKTVLRAHDLPTPPWRTLAALDAGAGTAEGRWLAKATVEHGSLGIDDDSVLPAGEPAELAAALRARLPRLGGAGFLERYVHGREFNVALLEVDGTPRCLPVGEMRFAGAFAGRPHLVGYRAKWDQDSADYRDTVRCLEFAPHERPLLDRLRTLALRTWAAFALSGYARVDFRVDESGAAWIIDVNANPCLTPGAGFPALLAADGIDYGSALAHIVRAGVHRAGAGR